MPVFLFTDFGSSDIYAGQVRAVLQELAPRQPVIDLLNDAPAFEVKASAHLLAALLARVPDSSVTMAVVDPGVGSSREAVALLVDGKWLVGPDNGLLSVLAARAKRQEVYQIGWRPKELSDSFHGRDLFAPVAAMLARGARKSAKLRRSTLSVSFGADDLHEVIYVDHFGNVMTGLRASTLKPLRALGLNGRTVQHARTFSEVSPGQLFWYENSIGLVEVAANSASAQRILGAGVGCVIE